MSNENDKEEVVPDFEEPRAPGVVSGTGQHQPVTQDESVSDEDVPGDDVPEAPDEYGHDQNESSEDVDERLADDSDDEDDDNEDNETA